MIKIPAAMKLFVLLNEECYCIRLSGVRGIIKYKYDELQINCASKVLASQQAPDTVWFRRSLKEHKCLTASQQNFKCCDKYFLFLGNFKACCVNH